VTRRQDEARGDMTRRHDDSQDDSQAGVNEEIQEALDWTGGSSLLCEASIVRGIYCAMPCVMKASIVVCLARHLLWYASHLTCYAMCHEAIYCAMPRI